MILSSNVFQFQAALLGLAYLGHAKRDVQKAQMFVIGFVVFTLLTLLFHVIRVATIEDDAEGVSRMILLLSPSSPLALCAPSPHRRLCVRERGKQDMDFGITLDLVMCATPSEHGNGLLMRQHKSLALIFTRACHASTL